MRNAAERKDIRRAEKASEFAESQRVRFLCAAMDTVEGRRWFHDLLARCRIFADPFSGDALVEAYSKGERNIGLQIYNDIVTNCPQSFIAMMKEASIKEITDARRSESDADESDPYASPDSDGEQPGGEGA